MACEIRSAKCAGGADENHTFPRRPAPNPCAAIIDNCHAAHAHARCRRGHRSLWRAAPSRSGFSARASPHASCAQATCPSLIAASDEPATHFPAPPTRTCCSAIMPVTAARRFKSLPPAGMPFPTWGRVDQSRHRSARQPSQHHHRPTVEVVLDFPVDRPVELRLVPSFRSKWDPVRPPACAGH